MRTFFYLLIICCHCTFGFATDFDVIVVGTSPICLLEALYQHYSGNKVLIVDGANECGGSWKSIDICGVSHADLGCHSFGNNTKLLKFLQEYVGCNIVTLDNPTEPIDFSQSCKDFYPSKGCHELIGNLLKLINKTDIVLLLNHKLECVSIDTDQCIATAKIKEMCFTASKIIITPCTDLTIENTKISQKIHPKKKFHHLYLLINDPTPPRFTFHKRGVSGVTRMMNLTHFVDLKDTGMQLIVFQVKDEECLKKGKKYVDQLIKEGFLDKSATVIQEESHCYEQSKQNYPLKNKKIAAVFENLDTNQFQTMVKYISKWEKILPLFDLVIKE